MKYDYPRGLFKIKKILVFGSTGMVGHVVTTYFESLGSFEVFNSSVEKFNNKTTVIDAFDRAAISDVLSSVRPDVVINCAGLLIRASENNPDIAFYLNSYFPHFLVRKGREVGFKVIHLSTDCVFSGKKGNYTEIDLKDGQGYYAISKAAGEIVNDTDLTFRMSTIGPDINKNGTGLLQWFLRQRGEVNGFVNTFWTGVTTLELARGIQAAIDQNLTGLYHFVPPSKISKYDLLCIINKIWNRNVIINKDDRFKSDKSLINTRKDFVFSFKTYQQMVQEMKDWVEIHQDFYSLTNQQKSETT